METVSWATPLYEFLRQCEDTPLDKRVLDCGAGGGRPPLSLFHRFGYTTYGIEIANEALDEVQGFSREQNMALNVFRGDMRHIPFSDDAFSFVYSYNAISFMTKPDIGQAMAEMTRVLGPEGLLYVNFGSVDDPDREPFSPTGPAYQLLKSECFAQYEDDEADAYFRGFQILRKEKRIYERRFDGRMIKNADVEYIARKRVQGEIQCQ